MKADKALKEHKSTNAAPAHAELPSAPQDSKLDSKLDSKQRSKSQRTRQTILQATVSCYYELGYHSTTFEHIAKHAGLSRGAMLYHFPSRSDLIKAAVEFLNDQRLAMFSEQETAAQAGAEYTRIEEGIDTYWRQLKTPAFAVFHELQVAARTDKELAAVLDPAMEKFAAAWGIQVRQIFPDLALSEAFERANLLTYYLMEGMAISHATNGSVPEQQMLSWLKRELRRSFQDVLGTVKR